MAGVSTVVFSLLVMALGGLGSASAASSGASPAAIGYAKSVVASQAKPITFGYNPGKLPGSVAGKRVVEVVDQTASGAENASLVASGAKILGINFQVVSVGATSEDVSNAFTNIVNTDSNLGGVIADGFDPTSWMPQFEALTAAHIPIVLVAVTCGAQWASYVKVLAPCTGTKQASQKPADWIIADSDGHPGNTVVFTTAGLPILTAASNAFIAQFKKLCAACTLNVQTVPLTSIATTLPATVVAYLQANPTTKYVFMTFGDMMIGVPPAVKAAGITGVKFTTASAAPTDVQYVNQGSEASVTAYPLPLTSYVAIDALSRLMLKANMSVVKSWAFPTQLMTKSNVSTFPATGYAPTPGLVSYFKKLWNK